MSADSPTATNRVQLRFALLASAVALLVLALFVYALSGVQWAIAPFVLALLSGVFGVGRLSRRSLALLRADVAAMFGGDAAPVAPVVQSAPVEPPLPAPPAPELVAAPPSSEPPEAAPPATPVGVRAERPHWLAWLSKAERGLGVAGLSAALVVLAVSLMLFHGEPRPTPAAWSGYLLAVVLAIAAAFALDGRWTTLISRLRAGVTLTITAGAILPWLGLGGILLFGLALRLYNLDGLPAGLWFDEFDNLDQAKFISDEPSHIPLFVISTNLPSAFLLPIALVIEFAGVHITSGRLVAAAFGVAGIAVMFFMVRHMLGTLMGLVAAFLTAVMRWDLNWSRIGMHGITAPLFAALTAWLTYRALRGGRLADFGLAGVAMGAGMWFYSAFRVFPLVIALILLHGLVSQRGRRRQLLLNIGIMALFSVIVAAPLIQFAALEPDEFFRRTSTTLVFTDAPPGESVDAILGNLRKHLLMFHIEGDPNGRHNLPGEPMLDLVSGLLMLGGIVAACLRWRGAAFVILPLWALIMLIPGILTLPHEAPQSLRSITVLPAVTALITLAVSELWRLVRSVRMGAVRRAAPLLLVGLLGVIAYANISTYFGAQASNERVYSAFSTDETLLSTDVLDELPSGYDFWFSEQYMVAYTLSVIAGSPHRRAISAPINIPLGSGDPPQGAAIYLEPREAGYFRTLKEYYPDARFAEIRPPQGGEPLLYTVKISPNILESRQGLMERRQVRGGGVIEAKKSDDLYIWFSDADGTVEVRLHGSLHIANPGEYALELQGGSDVQVTLDGMPLLSDRKRSVRIEPAVGLHAIEVRGRGSGAADALRVLWQPPGQEAFAAIPLGNLFNGSVRPVGLTGRFYDGARDADSVEGVAPDAMRITPDIGSAFWLEPVLDAPYFAVWDGTLNAPEGGAYMFKTENVFGELKVFIDGELAVSSDEGNDSNELMLSRGDHDIRLEYHAEGAPSAFDVLWAPPGQPLSHIAPEYLSPARDYMLRLVDGR